MESTFFNISDDFCPPFFNKVLVVLSIVLGSLDFSRKEFLGVEVGDVLILGKGVVRDKAGLSGTLNISPNFQSSVIIDERQVVVKQKLEKQ